LKVIDEIAGYIKNYRPRHSNNINFALHIVGVSQAVFGVFQILTGGWKMGILNVFLGYLWQWIGHTYFQKDEMGEVTGVKKLIRKFRRP